MDAPEFSKLCRKPEGRFLDFKAIDYDLSDENRKSRLLKDILCMANACLAKSSPGHNAHIVLGVLAKKGSAHKRHLGLPRVADDADLQQLVNSKLDEPVDFIYEPVRFRNKLFACITIRAPSDAPHSSRRDFGIVRRGTIYTRHGTRNAEASFAERQAMYRTAELLRRPEGARRAKQTDDGIEDTDYRPLPFSEAATSILADMRGILRSKGASSMRHLRPGGTELLAFEFAELSPIAGFLALSYPDRVNWRNFWRILLPIVRAEEEYSRSIVKKQGSRRSLYRALDHSLVRSGQPICEASCIIIASRQEVGLSARTNMGWLGERSVLARYPWGLYYRRDPSNVGSLEGGQLVRRYAFHFFLLRKCETRAKLAARVGALLSWLSSNAERMRPVAEEAKILISRRDRQRKRPLR